MNACTNPHDSKGPVDVLAVMLDAGDLLRRDGYKAIPHDLSEAHTVVAELIEAGRALIGKRGAVMALSQTDPRWVRYVAALARCGAGT